MSWEYSENVLVQNSADNLLHDALGWDVVYAYNKEALGETGTLGRKSYKNIILLRYLKKALFENDNRLTEELCEEAVKNLTSYSSSDILVHINQQKYTMLKDGIPVRFKKPNGQFGDRLNDEEKRYAREGLDSDEELAIYDLLFKDSLYPGGGSHLFNDKHVEKS